MNFGRLHAPDERDARYPMRALLAPEPLRTYRYWNRRGPVGDQGDEPSCVGWAWWHWLRCGPAWPKNVPTPNPLDIYHEAQTLDEWPGEDYDGTSVRGGAKAIANLVTEYRWAQTIEDVIEWVLHRGPVVMGTNWYSGMMNPSDYGDRCEPSGVVVGGHAYCITGCNIKRGIARLLNSWGPGWAGDGAAAIDLEDLERLLREDGEACTAVERAE